MKDAENINLLGPSFVNVKGQAAVDKLLQEKRGHVKAAFFRDDIGAIDLIWGEDGKRGFGTAHIIERRSKNDGNASVVLNNLARVVENGTLIRETKWDNNPRFIIEHDGYRVLVDADLRGANVQYVLTAYQIKKQHQR
ncbi:MAG: hypothetical protein FWD06_07975 [Oscillospiraceae bacterium]|nr:hypothetical protein [Oscillospiraceae bacterium]